MKTTNQTIEIKVKTNLDEVIEKANQLKSLLKEVKELAASLDTSVSVENGLSKLKKSPVKSATSFEPEEITGSKPDARLSDEQNEEMAYATGKIS
ncbi:MAG: hypothetical protein ABF449_06265 [Ethanoligenens sp.]